MEKNYQFGRSKSLLVGLCALTSVFVSSTITITAFGLNKEDACVNAEGAITENKISLTEIQLRSIDGTDAWYSYLVFLSDSYNDVAGVGEPGIENGLAISNLSGVKLYTKDSAGDLVENSITPNHIETHKWDQKGSFIGFDEYVTGLNGSNVYQVFIPAGTKVAISSSEVFVIDKDYTFTNNSYGDASVKLGAYGWAMSSSTVLSEKTISLTGIQLRSSDVTSVSDSYLVLKSDSFDDVASTNGAWVMIDGNNGKEKSEFSGVKLYAKDSSGQLAGNSITVGHLETTKWGQPGSFIAFDEYTAGLDGANVYKVFIPGGTKVAVSSDTIFVVDKDYTFYNDSYGQEEAKAGSFLWSEKAKIPFATENQEISLSGIQLRGIGGDQSNNDWYNYLGLLSDSFASLDLASDNVFGGVSGSDLSGVRLYTQDSAGGLVAHSITANHLEINRCVGLNVQGAFFAFNEYKDGVDGSSVYKVYIPKGTKILYELSGESGKALLVDKNYTFYNVNFGNGSAKFASFSWWDTPIPSNIENTGDIRIRGISDQSDGVTRWLIVWLNDEYAETKDGTFYETLGYSNILDNVVLYTSSDLSKEPTKLRDVFSGSITMAQFGSKDALGFTIQNDASLNGSNLYAVSVEKGCEIPFQKDGLYSKRTVSSTTTFLNDNYGKTGEIPGETGADKRTYEDWSISWSQASFLTYKVVGASRSFARACLPVGSKIAASAFTLDGYDVSIQDNLGYSYYGEIVVPEYDAEITLTYSVRVDEPEEEEPSEDSSALSPLAIGLIVGGGGAIALGGIAVLIILAKKKKA